MATTVVKTVTLEEANGHLNELVDLIDQGTEVQITRHNKPNLELVENPKPRKLGLHEGAIIMHDNFDDPLPDEFWLGGNP